MPETVQQAESQPWSRQDYKAARDMIGAALQAAGTSGVDRKSICTGLWHAAIAMVIEAAPDEILADIIEDKLATLKGQGYNADAPQLRLTEDEAERRKTDSLKVAELVAAFAEPFMQSLEARGVDSISCVLDAVLGVLAEAWGPAHLRRILRDQSDAFRDGYLSPILPVEPAIPNRPRPPARPQPKAEVKAEPAQMPVPAPPSPEPISFTPPPPAKKRPVYRPGKGRRIEMDVRSQMIRDRDSVFAVVIRIYHGENEMTELREIDGFAPDDPIGRRGSLIACTSALVGLGEPAENETVRIVVSSESIYGEMSGTNQRARPMGETALWDQLEALCEDRIVEWELGKGGINGELAGRCDALLRKRLKDRDKVPA